MKLKDLLKEEKFSVKIKFDNVRFSGFVGLGNDLDYQLIFKVVNRQELLPHVSIKQTKEKQYVPASKIRILDGNVYEPLYTILNQIGKANYPTNRTLNVHYIGGGVLDFIYYDVLIKKPYEGFWKGNDMQKIPQKYEKQIRQKLNNKTFDIQIEIK